MRDEKRQTVDTPGVKSDPVFPNKHALQIILCLTRVPGECPHLEAYRVLSQSHLLGHVSGRGHMLYAHI